MKLHSPTETGRKKVKSDFNSVSCFISGFFSMVHFKLEIFVVHTKATNIFLFQYESCSVYTMKRSCSVLLMFLQWHSQEFESGVHNCVIVSNQCTDFLIPSLATAKYYVFS